MSEILQEVRALRRRARADRHAYWLPVLYFAVSICAAAPLYVLPDFYRMTPEELTAYDETGWRLQTRISAYWTSVLLVGALLSVWWYRRGGRRTGVEGRVDGAVLAGVVVVLAVAVFQLLPLPPFWPTALADYLPLLVIAVGLLALARLERSVGLLLIAVAYAVALLAANPHTVEHLAVAFGGEYPFNPDSGLWRFSQLPSLLAPAAVLLVGGAAAGVRTALSRRAG